MIRPATPQDFDFIMECSKQFFAESNYGKLTWDEEKAKEICEILTDGRCFCLIAEGQGFVAWTHERYWTVEEVAHIFLFYVKSECRNGKIALQLAFAMDNILLEHRIAMCYASSTGGFDDGGINERAFTRLFSRVGYKNMGSFLIKEYNHG